MIPGKLVAGLVHLSKSALPDLGDDPVDFCARGLELASGGLWDLRGLGSCGWCCGSRGRRFFQGLRGGELGRGRGLLHCRRRRWTGRFQG